MSMQLSDFDYELPDELIARYPRPLRSASRLLYLESVTGNIDHREFTDILQLINSNDLLVFNNTRVIPARLFGLKTSGGRVEIMVERIYSEECVLAQIRASKSPKVGTTVLLEREIVATLIEKQNKFYLLKFSFQNSDKAVSVLEVLDKIGHIPLPPYFGREDEPLDRDRYQTVYAKYDGAVAAPTAGLHFDETLLAQLKKKGVDTAFVTLHVGAGTFQPVRVQDITAHRMHSESMEVNKDVCDKIIAAHARGGRVIAVGTTSLRCLETAAQAGSLQPFAGETNIFIYPGYQFNVVDALITNFHQPQSTLMMLVCAFAGYEPLMRAYKAAVEGRYRFLSYGDAMFINRFKVD